VFTCARLDQTSRQCWPLVGSVEERSLTWYVDVVVPDVQCVNSYILRLNNEKERAVFVVSQLTEGVLCRPLAKHCQFACTDTHIGLLSDNTTLHLCEYG